MSQYSMPQNDRAQPDPGSALGERGIKQDFSPGGIDALLLRGEKVDLSMLSRQERLEVINDWLAVNGLRLLEGLGDSAKGQMEWVGINAFIPDRFVARVDFEAQLASGGKVNRFNHLVFLNCNSLRQGGALIVALVEPEKNPADRYVLLVKQFRPVIGRETLELPRGFPDADDFLASKPVQTALRELEEETQLLSQHRDAVREISEVGAVYENTGTANIKNTVFKMRVVLSPALMEQAAHHMHHEPSGHAVRTYLLPVAEALAVLEDQHSLAALAKCIWG